ncbi:MAG TPA: hypothetical protein VHY35_19405 [Stellaceae bacterium]|jgi:hypothetical protein|nr:hypothetical protein [Stellaceae bacterium]
MIARRLPGRGGWPVFLLALLAACQPLPHPFEDDKPPAALLHMRDVAGVSIAPIEGVGDESAAKLASAVVAAFLTHDIPASDKTSSLGSYQLYGRVVQKPAKKKDTTTVTALWRLYASDGRSVGERSVNISAKTSDWKSGKDAPFDQIADLSASKLAPMMEDEAPVEAKAPDQNSLRTRIAIGKITGAPGDGGSSLANAVGGVLRRQEVAIADKGEKADLTLDGQVEVAPVKAGKQHVKIVWRMRRADGAEIGTVDQENDVPHDVLNGPWGDLAYNIAIAASDGLLQLVARGAPPPHS